MAEPTKTCRICGGEKSVEAFYRRADRLDGRDSRCKDCVSAYYKERRANFTPEKRERDRANWRRYYRTNPVTLAAKRVRERDARLERLAKNNAENVEALAMHRGRTGARRRGATVLDLVSPLVVLELHDGVCGICGEDVDPFAYDLDHIVPLSRGGFHTLENLQPAHPACNRQKAATERAAA